MKKLLLTSVAFAALIAGPATAADLARPVYRHPVVVAAPVYSWTGFYVGGEVGAKWTDSQWTTTSLISPPFTTIVDASSPSDFSSSSIRAGGYVGYNWQFAPLWVAGIEFDIAYADRTTTTAGIPGCAVLCIVGFPGPQTDLSSVRSQWDSSARARLGVLVTPDTLLYATGGIAWQKIETSATCQHSAPDPLCLFLPGNPFATGTNTFTRPGWTVGGGVDWRLFGNWIARAEYRFSQFTQDNVLDLSLPGAPTAVNYHLKTNTNIATVGLAYKFGYEAAPAVYK
jgi:outer membrane immunogenic protein